MVIITSKDRTKFEKEFINEVKEMGKTSLAKSREGPLIGLIFFNIALWGSKIFTYLSPGTSVKFQWLGTEIHFHHFNYGVIALVIGIMITFLKGPWAVRFANLIFGVGLGLIIDEYWILLTFEGNVYFEPESYQVSVGIGLVITIIYLIIVIVLFIFSKDDKKMWDELYDSIKSGKLKIKI